MMMSDGLIGPLSCNSSGWPHVMIQDGRAQQEAEKPVMLSRASLKGEVGSGFSRLGLLRLLCRQTLELATALSCNERNSFLLLHLHCSQQHEQLGVSRVQVSWLELATAA